ncbi:MAG: SDR family NAD(P)-dependent oxidoreductase [Ketobacteraceae bacterium]|nr:SDR family NAD(P)-dependent oxidoreductase [Ketobacteraceae bacterium]
MTSVWLIGASSGIGRALAEQYARQNIVLYLSSRHIQDSEADWRNARADVRLRPFDLQNRDECAAVTAAILEENGAPDLVIFAAGMIAYDDCWHMDPQLERRLFEVNYWGPQAITRQLMEPMMLRQRGHLVYLGSLSGFVASPLRSTYSASKHALQGYVNALRAEMKAFRVKVTLVCPGFVDTGIDQRSLYGNGELRKTRDENRLPGLSAAECARRMIQGIGAGREQLVIGGRERLMLPLQRFFPATVRRLLPGFRPSFAPPPGQLVNLGSGTTEYFIHGHGPQRIVMLNGITSSFDVWWEVLRDLDPEKYQVLLYNYYGRGKSETASERAGLALLDAQLDELLATLDWRPEQCHWVSYSWGCGWLNRWLLNRDVMPQSLVLVAPAYWNPTLLRSLEGLRHSRLVHQLFLLAGRWLLYADYRRYCNTGFIAKAFWPRIKGHIARPAFLPMFVGQLTEDVENWPRYFKEVSVKMKQHIAVIRGADDGKSTDSDGYDIARNLGIGKVTDLPGASHLLPLEASLGLARYIDHFITDQTGSDSGHHED